MAFIAYPAALPVPAGYPFTPRERRAASPQPGLTQHRGRSREQIVDVKGVRWVYSPAQMHTWRAWFEDTLLDGQLWFAVSLPGDGGWQTRVARYVSGTVRDSEVAGFFTVTADLEVNGSRVAPQDPAPSPTVCWESSQEGVGVTLPSHIACYGSPLEAITADNEFLGGEEAGYFVVGCYVSEIDGLNYCTTQQVFPGTPGFTVTTERLMTPRYED